MTRRLTKRKKLLTIAVPTYNRQKLLVQNIEALLPQIDLDCRLLVIDNASEPPLKDFLNPLIKQFKDLDFCLITNSVNIGGNANVLRCIELCDTEWIWIVGDDDVVKPNAVALVKLEIQREPSAIVVNFAGPGLSREKSLSTEGRFNFIRSWDSFSNILFISTNVYNTVWMKRNLWQGYFYSYTCAPHLATLLSAMNKNSVAIFSKDQIIEKQCVVSGAESWAPINVFLGKMILLELPLSATERSQLYQKLRIRPRLELLVIYLIKRQIAGECRKEALFLFDHVNYRINYHHRWHPSVCVRWMYRLMIKYPRFGNYVAKVLYSKAKWIALTQTHSYNQIAAVGRQSRL